MEIGLLREYLADVQTELLSLVNEKKNEDDDEFDVSWTLPWELNNCHIFHFPRGAYFAHAYCGRGLDT